MIEILIDKTKATPEELLAFEALDGYSALLSAITSKGRQMGICLTIREHALGEGTLWLQNGTNGCLSAVIEPNSEGKSMDSAGWRALTEIPTSTKKMV